MSKSKKQKVVAVSGGFDPIHVGHVRLFEQARKLGDRLVVIINNDNWLKKKKGFAFMSQNERREVIEALGCVDEVVITGHRHNAKDMSVNAELRKVRPNIFANGGDRTSGNIPEIPVCNKIGCKMVFSVGQGGKIQSSSWLLERYQKLLKPKKINRRAMTRHLAETSRVFKESSVNLPFELKMKLADFLLDLMSRKKNFGLFVILGWQSRWYKFTDISDIDQDIFQKDHVNIVDLGKQSLKGHDIETTINFDGAILVGEKGNILHSGVVIEGLRPKIAAQEINPGKFRDLSDQFGFKRKVHTRHLSAITASYIFPGTTIFTISEEVNDFHIFEAGKIIYSMP